MGWRAGLLLVLGVGSLALIGLKLAHDDSLPKDADCTRLSGEGGGGLPLQPAVKLTPDLAGQVVNFGGSRGWRYVDVVLNATPALPRSVNAKAIRFDVPRRFSRTSDRLSTVSAPRPSFTEPSISPGGDRIAFSVCLDGATLESGSYSGSVLVEGPKGLGPTTISFTENARNSGLAFWGGLTVLAIAFFFLVLRGAAARQVKAEERNAQDVARAESETGLAEALKRTQEHPPKRVRSYIVEVFQDLNWWVTSVVALGLAAASIYGIYSADPAWGSDTVGSVISLVGPAFTAVGVQSVVTALGRSVEH